MTQTKKIKLIFFAQVLIILIFASCKKTDKNISDLESSPLLLQELESSQNQQSLSQEVELSHEPQLSQEAESLFETDGLSFELQSLQEIKSSQELESLQTQSAESSQKTQEIKSLNIYDYALNLPGTYSSENSQKPSSWFAYYFLGWSKDSKISYIEESYSDGSGIHLAKLKIQDLVSDKIVFEKVLYKSELENGDVSLNLAINQNLPEILNELSSFKIILQKVELQKFPVKFGDFLIQAKVLESESKTEIGFVDFTVEAVRSDNKKKVVTSNSNATDFPHEKIAYCASVDFYLKSPYENRVAFLIHTVCRGFECQVDEYRMAGCLLTSGFE